MAGEILQLVRIEAGCDLASGRVWRIECLVRTRVQLNLSKSDHVQIVCREMPHSNELMGKMFVSVAGSALVKA